MPPLLRCVAIRFLAAFQAKDLFDRLVANPDTRKHMADPGFVKQIEKLRDLACDPKLDCNDLTQTSAVSQQIAKTGHYDPRVMQALMMLQGQGLTVEEKDLKRAEDFGDMPRREPVQLEQLQLVKNVTDPEVARTKGNEYFKSGDYAAALAHYECGVELLKKGEEVPATALATLFSNSAMALLKLKWPDRAKKEASKAIAVIRQAEDNTTFDQSKLFYRRALACEQLRDFTMAVDDMERAFKQAKKSSLDLKEQHRLKGEVDRLKKLKASNEELEKRRQQEKENERTAEVQRMQGTELAPKKTAASSSAKASGGYAGAAVAVPSDLSVSDGYIQERDFSHWARQQVESVVKGIVHTVKKSGTKIEITEMQQQSKVQASITQKRGKRALYYDMDLHLKWIGTPTKGKDTLPGLIRVYNIGHDTKFELGGDENTCYMYQLGWDHRMTGAWVDEIKTEAAELFDLVAIKVDSVIHELRKK